jgi:signal transduction histidine kinase
MRDVTADHLVANALALTRVKTEFLAKVGHELRTPLTSLLGITEMLASNVFGPLSDDQQEAVRLMSSSVNNMVRLVNDLLQQTRLERGTFQLEEADFSMSAVVDRLRESLKPKAVAKGLALIMELAPDVPSRLYGDSLRMYQILLNLGENAIKYTLAGHVLIRIFCQDNEHLVFQVADTGIGVPVEMQNYIFDAFQQGKYAPELEKGGLGLGLSIVTQLVELMKGELMLKSEVGKGSVFTVTLPLHTVGEENL